MKERTDGRTNGQAENIMLPPASLAWWMHQTSFFNKTYRCTCQCHPALWRGSVRSPCQISRLCIYHIRVGLIQLHCYIAIEACKHGNLLLEMQPACIGCCTAYTEKNADLFPPPPPFIEDLSVYFIT